MLIFTIAALVSVSFSQSLCKRRLRPNQEKVRSATQRCGNKTMAMQGAVLQDIVSTHLHTRVVRSAQEDYDPERFQGAVRAYRKFIKAVEAGNGASAEKQWRTHMDAAEQYLLKDDLKTKPVVDLFS